jgi:hypothetical protein
MRYRRFSRFLLIKLDIENEFFSSSSHLRLFWGICSVNFKCSRSFFVCINEREMISFAQFACATLSRALNRMFFSSSRRNGNWHPKKKVLQFYCTSRKLN